MAATAETTGAELVEFDLGPIKVGVSAAALEFEDAPTVDGLVDAAWTVLPAKVDGWHTKFGATAGSPAERYALAKKATKAQREAAKFAVFGTTYTGPVGDRNGAKKWYSPDGKRLTRAELAPLVTAVRAALAADCRRKEREALKRERDDARGKARLAKAREKAIAKLLDGSAAEYAAFVLPLDVKLAKGVSKDETRPVMTHAHLYRCGKRWEILVTDSYTAVVVPVQTNHDKAFEHVQGGYHVIPNEALKAIDKAGAFRIDKTGAVVPVEVNERTVYLTEAGRPSPGYTEHHVYVPTRRDVGSGYMPPATTDRMDAVTVYGGTRKVRNLRTKRMHSTRVQPMIAEVPPERHRIEITLDADLLEQVAGAIAKGGHVRVAIDARELEKTDAGVRRLGVVKRAGAKVAPQIHVLPKDNMETRSRKSARSAGVRAVQMPVRPS